MENDHHSSFWIVYMHYVVLVLLRRGGGGARVFLSACARVVLMLLRPSNACRCYLVINVCARVIEENLLPELCPAVSSLSGCSLLSYKHARFSLPLTGGACVVLALLCPTGVCRRYLVVSTCACGWGACPDFSWPPFLPPLVTLPQEDCVADLLVHLRGISSGGGSNGWSPPSLLLLGKEREKKFYSNSSSRTDDTGRTMFSRAHVPLAGGDFRARFDGLPTQARTNYEQLDVFAQLLTPVKWMDQLSSSQKLRFHTVATPAEWNNVALTFRLALQKVPVLSFSALSVAGDPRYVVIGVYDVHVAVFSMEALKQVEINWLRWADLLPAELKEWLVDSSILVLIAEGSSVPDVVTGIEANNVVSTNNLYMMYQSKGVVHPVVPTADGALAKQMAYCFNYFHQPCSPEFFRQLCGEHQYKRWPEHRQPGWKPKSAFDFKVREEFFLFFEAVGPWAFIYHLLRHGIVYGDLEAVAPTLPLAQLIPDFLCTAGRSKVTVSTDPLGIAADVAEAGREEGETLELSDRRLEAELGGEGETTAPPDHPGYFTSTPGGVAAREAADKMSGAPSKGKDVASQRLPTAVGDAGAENALAGDSTMDCTVASTGETGGIPREKGTVPRDGATPGGVEASSSSRRRPSRGRSPPRKRHHSWPQPPKPAPWNAMLAAASGGRPSPWSVDLRSQLSLPSNNNSSPVVAKMSAAVAAAQFYPAAVPAADISASCSYDSPQDLRARLDVRRGLAALAGEALEETKEATDVPLDYNLCFAQRTLRAARRGDAAATGGEFHPPEEEGDEDAGFPAIERDPLNLFLTAAERAYNPFAEHPLFHGRCGFCSGGHCSRSNHAGTGPNCKKLRQHLKFTPTRRICLYRRCPASTEHHTPVCPTLHRRCMYCNCRGHGEDDGCDMSSAIIMSRLRADFEECAGLGFYTRLRFGQIEWGFYPLPTTVPQQPVVSYVRLTNLPVLEACRLVAELTALPQNMVAAVPETLPPTDARLGKVRIAAAGSGDAVDTGGWTTGEDD